ncbi:hypothetical protein DFH06DRAFT_466875 [Mycena polygramma]|nr:hypothetical protein DFH06DRAFT_466875 [Mycena polygramma]
MSSGRPSSLQSSVQLLSLGPTVNYPPRLLEEQISRSGTLPLEVFIISKETFRYTTGKLFQILLSCSNRWQTLHLEAHFPLTDHHLLAGNLSLLREIFLRVSSNVHLGTHSFQHAPQLRVAHVGDAQIMSRGSPHLSFVALPWEQLTTFKSMYRDRRQFDGFLLAYNLVECQFAVDRRDPRGAPPWQAPAQPVVFPQLKKLTLEAPSMFLDALALPALEELFILPSSPRESSTLMQHLLLLLHRSACSLRKFWTTARPSVAQFIQVPLDNPRICEIGMMGDGSGGRIRENVHTIAEVLTLSTVAAGGSPAYASELARFVVFDRNLDMNFVLDMVDSCVQLSHLHGCSRLETLSLFTRTSPQEEFGARFAVLRAAGAHVEVRIADKTDSGESRELFEILRAKDRANMDPFG